MPQKNNMLLAFFQELLQRFFTKSPKFFRIWQAIAGIATLVTGLPEFLEWIGVTLPESLTILQDKVIGGVSFGLFIMSALTTQSKPASVTSDGVVLKTTSPEKLPFTFQAEVKKAQVDQVPNSTKTIEEVKV